MTRILQAAALLLVLVVAGRARRKKGGNARLQSGVSSWRGISKLAVVLGTAVVMGGFLVAATGIIPIKASSGHWDVTAWFLQFSKQRSVSTHTLGLEAPPLEDPALVLRGAGHFETACRPCHGSPGTRTPRIAAAMTPPPPYLPPRVSGWDREELFYIVKHGVKFTGMPAWPTQQRDDEVWAMTAFLLRFEKMNEREYHDLVWGDSARPPDAPLENLKGADATPVAITQNCARCHGLDGDGRGNAAFPRLAGQSPAYLIASMRAYADGDRHSGIMEPIAAGLGDDQREAIARYYAGLEPAFIPQSAIAQPSIDRGREIALRGVPKQRLPACSACHGPGTLPRNPNYPNLTGQYGDYLTLQLELFKARRRGGSAYAHVMDPVVDRMTPQQMRDVSAYYSSLATATDAARQ